MTIPSRFLLLGEPPSIDLVNTRIRRNGVDVDLLETRTALADWLRAESDRLTWPGTVNATDLAAVRALRDAIADLLRAMREGTRPPAAALENVNEALSAPAAQNRLVWPASGPHLSPPAAGLRRGTLLRTLAADAVEILTGPQAKRLRKCAHPDCVLQFIAQNQRRHWCSDSICGNRARVARHYLHQRQAR
jgi:predicted RNA-binding Zn ribbon-like protein